MFNQAPLVRLNVIADERGSMVVLEKAHNLTFDLKRAYYIFGTQLGVSRGHHAHKHLKQLAICLAGHCKLILDDGQSRQNFLLDSPKIGVMINPMIWREIHDLSENCVLAVFASECYSESDYIRHYDQFLEAIREANPYCKQNVPA